MGNFLNVKPNTKIPDETSSTYQRSKYVRIDRRLAMIQPEEFKYKHINDTFTKQFLTPTEYDKKKIKQEYNHFYDNTINKFLASKDAQPMNIIHAPPFDTNKIILDTTDTSTDVVELEFLLKIESIDDNAVQVKNSIKCELAPHAYSDIDH